MIIREICEIDSSNLEYQDLFYYLSQIVLSKTDEEIETKHKEFLESSDSLEKAKDELKDIKKNLLSCSREIGRLQTMTSIVSMIDTLKKEGVLFGDKRSKVLGALNDITSKNVSQLRELEDKLRLLTIK